MYFDISNNMHFGIIFGQTFESVFKTVAEGGGGGGVVDGVLLF